MPMLSRRASSILSILLGLFLIGTVIVLTTAKAYFSIDNSAYILPQELGTLEQIRQNTPFPTPDDRTSWLASQSSSPISNQTFTSAEDNVAKLSPWRDNSVKPYDPSDPPEKIPRIVHQTWKDENLPPRWKTVRDECAAMHPDYEYKLWTDADSRKFIAENYSWFLSVFDSYPYPIQRADAIRYFVLHHYGGIYMDLDIGCLRRFDPLLRFEVVLPKTIPVGVSNDVMLSQKGHPFMDQLIHNLVTFNHQYLTNYPTVMFSTGPMFVSASYGLYVDAHGPATPSTPEKPLNGFTGIRVLPKSLYGKNVKPLEAPDAFFSHFYGSSWHANDAGFLIFLRKYGTILMLVGTCIAVYGTFKSFLRKFLFQIVDRPARHRSRSERSGTWISLPVVGSNVSLGRQKYKRQSLSEDHSGPVDHLTDYSPAGCSSTATGSRLSMPAPRPRRLSLPLFQLQETEATAREPPQSVLAWVGQTLSRPSSRNDSLLGDVDFSTNLFRQAKKKTGVLYLPAYFVSRDDVSSSMSPSSSMSSTPSGPPNTNSLGQWASSLFPASWRGPSPAPSNASRLSRGGDELDLESVDSASGDEDSSAAPLMPKDSQTQKPSTGRFARSWTDSKDKASLNPPSAAPVFTSPDHYERPDPLDTVSGNARMTAGGILLPSMRGPSVSVRAPASSPGLLRRIPSSNGLHDTEDTPLSTIYVPPPPYPSSPDDKSPRAEKDTILHAPQPQRVILDTQDMEGSWDDMNAADPENGANSVPLSPDLPYRSESRGAQPAAYTDTIEGKPEKV